jgi:hypothetical protein
VSKIVRKLTHVRNYFDSLNDVRVSGGNARFDGGVPVVGRDDRRTVPGPDGGGGGDGGRVVRVALLRDAVSCGGGAVERG